jgi:tRNA/rRNA methyltransferase
MDTISEILTRTAVVLHRPIYPRNIGMCARAMGNLGCQELHIIAPRCDWQSSMVHHELRQGATHGADVIKTAHLHDSLHSFLEKNGQGVRIGFTAREGYGRRIQDFSQLINRLVTEADHPIHASETLVQLHFGTEDDGMSLQELEPMNFLCKIPSTAKVPSFNLSHAVLLAMHILATDYDRHVTQFSGLPFQGNALPPGRLEYPKKAIREWLEILGFDLDSRKISIETSLNRVLLSHCPTLEDVRLVEKVLFQTVGKLKRNAHSSASHQNAARGTR